jgi:L-asparaginase
MRKKRVYIAYTGGTIGMQKRKGSYAPSPLYLAKRMAAMPELHDQVMPDYDLHEYEPLLDSSNMRPRNWQMIADDIELNYNHYDGFVVLHGTDTMAYTASALSFMLENLAKPVILTGSQIPLAEVRSDARENLITSMLIAANYLIPEVCIYLNSRLLRGNRSTKVSSTGFDAFDSPNLPALGQVGVEIALNKELILAKPKVYFRVQQLQNVQVAALRLFPGISAELLANLLLKPLQAVVLETYGAGNAPEDEALLSVLKEATERGVIIVNISQCLKGRVAMQDYAAGSKLERAGLISGADMTAEAALGKLSYLLSCDLSIEKVKSLVQESLRGELSP